MKRNIIHISVLIIILFSGITTFLFVRENPVLQLITGISTCIAYMLWGITHNLIKGDLHKKVVIEYLLIGAIAILVLIVAIRS